MAPLPALFESFPEAAPLEPEDPALDAPAFLLERERPDDAPLEVFFEPEDFFEPADFFLPAAWLVGLPGPDFAPLPLVPAFPVVDFLLEADFFADACFFVAVFLAADFPVPDPPADLPVAALPVVRFLLELFRVVDFFAAAFFVPALPAPAFFLTPVFREAALLVEPPEGDLAVVVFLFVVFLEVVFFLVTDVFLVEPVRERPAERDVAPPRFDDPLELPVDPARPFLEEAFFFDTAVTRAPQRGEAVVSPPHPAAGPATVGV